MSKNLVNYVPTMSCHFASKSNTNCVTYPSPQTLDELDMASMRYDHVCTFDETMSRSELKNFFGYFFRFSKKKKNAHIKCLIFMTFLNGDTVAGFVLVQHYY